MTKRESYGNRLKISVTPSSKHILSHAGTHFHLFYHISNLISFLIQNWHSLCQERTSLTNADKFSGHLTDIISNR